MRTVFRFIVAALVLGAPLAALAENSVTVLSMTVGNGAPGVVIPIRMTNDEELATIDIPLIVRSVSGGAFITSVALGYGDRLPEGPGQPLSDWIYKAQYINEDGHCKNGQAGGFGAPTYTDGGPHPVAASPEGVRFLRSWLGASPYLSPGNDITGSMLLTVGVAPTSGIFEIDTTCVDAVTHLTFASSLGYTVPVAFTAGRIEVLTASNAPPAFVDCPTVDTLAASSGGLDRLQLFAIDDGVPGGLTLSADVLPTGAILQDYGNGHGAILWSPTCADIGAHPFRVIASDGQLTDLCVGTITVEDQTPPVIDCPSDITVLRDPGHEGAIVTFTESASDQCGLADFSCSPPSGSFFPLGTTQVQCIAVDDAGLSDTCEFTVTVMEPGSVVVESKAVSEGETGVLIPVRIANDVSIKSLMVPLILRAVTPGAFVTQLALSYGDRLPTTPGAPLSDLIVLNQYEDEDGNCKNGQPGGFLTVVNDDGSPYPVVSSPAAVAFGRFKLFGASLPPGIDATGSLLITANMTAVAGLFEIDTTCTGGANHLAFANDLNQLLLPSFHKGIITIGNPCSCPYQCDYDSDGFLTSLDLGDLIDVLFAGAPEIQDPNCPTSRGDFDNDGFPTSLDLGDLIDHLFAGAPPPIDPCE